MAPRTKDPRTTVTDAAEKPPENEYEVEELPEDVEGSSRGFMALLASEFPIRQFRRRASGEKVLESFVIDPENWWYKLWTQFILVWAVYSSAFTPMEFGFFRGLPKNLFFLDIVGQIAFLFDIAAQFLLAYREPHSYRMNYNPSCIALRYLKSGFLFDLLSCFPWDAIYKACGSREEVRYLLWIRLTRVRKVTDFFQKMEKDIRINYLFTRIVKLIVVELYCTHTAACIFYYLATTVPESMEGYTWIGSLTLGDYSYTHFRDIDLSKRYLTSLYFAIVTMATVGYGDVHAVNIREMVFIMIFVSFDMILGAYLVGNMTALIVKGSKTERFRDKMKDLIKFMNKNKLKGEIRDQIKRHVRLQCESSYAEVSVLQDLPISIRAKISQTLYKENVKNAPLFKGCSEEFIHQIAIRLQEELFLPGEVILEQGNAVDQLYFVCQGILERTRMSRTSEGGSEENIMQLERNDTFGEIAVLCNIPQPYTVRVCEPCKLLRLEKQIFMNILELYFYDGRKILRNLLEGNKSIDQFKQLESDITFHIGKQEAELALRVNSAAYHGDLNHLKSLIRAGANPKMTDYDGRSALHLAASKGYEDITLFLIQEGVEIHHPDKFGYTPLLEAVEQEHERVASLLFSRGARLTLKDPGSRLCSAVAKGDVDFIKRVLRYGVDPNSKDYDHRTPLHIAAAEGSCLIAQLLLEAGASVFATDRWGNTPLDEARKSGSRSLMKLLEDAKSEELSKYPGRGQEVQDKMHPRKCTVFPFHPWEFEERKKEGVVLWIPHTIEELIESSRQLLSCSGSRILSEDGGWISDVDIVSDGQKLYLVKGQDGSDDGRHV